MQNEGNRSESAATVVVVLVVAMVAVIATRATKQRKLKSKQKIVRMKWFKVKGNGAAAIVCSIKESPNVIKIF